MGLSIEEQREKIRERRNPKRFYKVSHLKVDTTKIKASTEKKRKQKIESIKKAVSDKLGYDYYLSPKKMKQLEKLRNKDLRKSKRLKAQKELSKGTSKRKQKYIEYLLSDEWAQIRIDLFKFRGYSCERCSNPKNLHVHHLHYDNIFNEEPEDLEILCATCHSKEHKILSKSKK